MNKKLLLSLADAIESDQVPEDQFNMNVWGKENGLFCGCAIGWGVKLGILKDITFKSHSYKLNEKELDYKLNHSLVGYDIPSKIFNISYNEACDLFHPHYYDNRNKQNVVDRIRKFVKNGVK